jgi:hypothetical protein
MNIKNHGAWHRYQPATLPVGAPANALFAQRENDAADWYDYVNSGENFAPDSIKMTIVGGAVAAAVTDPTMLFPGGATVLEVSGVQVRDPQEAFGRKVYDATHRTFSDPPPFDFPDPMADLRKRLDALEAKGT